MPHCDSGYTGVCENTEKHGEKYITLSGKEIGYIGHWTERLCVHIRCIHIDALSVKTKVKLGVREIVCGI